MRTLRHYPFAFFSSRARRRAVFAIAAAWLLAGSVKSRAATTLPEPLPGNSDYLVRVVYLIPQDRMLDYKAGAPGPKYVAKVADATARIRTALETIDDFVTQEVGRYPDLAPYAGQRYNFEREGGGNGPVRVLVVNGARPTRGASGYWADGQGMNGAGACGAVIEDVLGWSELQKKTQKRVYMIVPDIGEWDAALPGFRGYMGLGTSVRGNSGGWGGYATFTSSLLQFIPPDPGTPQARKLALERALSSQAPEVTAPNPYTGAPETWNLRLLPSQATLGKNLSLYLGVIAHELQHAMGLGHGGMNPLPAYVDLMGGGYGRFGHAVSRMYGFGPQAYPYDPPNARSHDQICSLGVPYTHFLTRTPYRSRAANPDKADPLVKVAYPPGGWAMSSLGALACRAIDEPGGSGLDAAYLFSGIDVRQGALFRQVAEDGQPARAILAGLTFTSGRNEFSVAGTDKAGNLGRDVWVGFCMTDGDTVKDNCVYVRPAGATRTPAAARGSYRNACDSIQEGIDNAAALGRGVVFITNGVYPILAPLHLHPQVSLIGQMVGQVVLDGQHNQSLDLLEISGAQNNPADAMIANLTLVNARSGLVKRDASFNTFNFTLANCIFARLDDAAVSLPSLDLNVSIVQNSVVDCGSGLIFADYPHRPDAAATLDDPGFSFACRNNLVIHTRGAGRTGLELKNIAGLRTKGRNGWNNVHGFASNFAGSLDYGGSRLPGEVSAPVQFNQKTPLDFSLAPGSRGVHEGDPLTENADGSRRDLGAVINNGLTPSGRN